MVIIHPIAGLYTNAASKISSLEKKPENGGMPEMAKQEMRKVICVMGIYLRIPPIALISLL